MRQQHAYYIDKICQRRRKQTKFLKAFDTNHKYHDASEGNQEFFILLVRRHHMTFIMILSCHHFNSFSPKADINMFAILQGSSIFPAKLLMPSLPRIGNMAD